MRNSKILSIRNIIGHLATAGIATAAIALGPLAAKAATVNVYIDPSYPWQGYENVYYQNGNYWFGNYYAPGSPQAAGVQGAINNSGIVIGAPDIDLDTYNHNDTNAWADASGTSVGICNVDSTFYIDTTAVGQAGDTIIFTGTLVTNTLVAPYTNQVYAFIKDYSSSWAYYGIAQVYLNTLTNGGQFSVVWPSVVNTGDHIQWGFEWNGPPARTNVTASSYVGNMGFFECSSNSVLPTGPQILAVNPPAAQALLGSNQTFTAIVSGNGLTYQWKLNGSNLSDGPGISGSHTNVLALSNVACSQEGTYTLVVTDSSSLKATNQASLVVFNPGWLYYDRALAPFSGYINVWNSPDRTNRPSSGAGGTSPVANFGFGVAPTTLLRASQNPNNDVVTLQPNTYVYDGATNTMNPAYINPDGSSAAYLEQDYYIQNDGLVQQSLIFAGYCNSNSLDPAYTATAWIKDGSSDWSVEHRYDTNLVGGQPFILALPSPAPAGDHIQYGFAIWGPDNSGTNPITQGAAVVTVYSPIGAVLSGGSIDLDFPTVINHSYTVQFKTNVTGSWHNLSTNNGTGTTVTVPDSTSNSNRFYRLWTR
jgi:hypothetical protein